MTSMNRTCGNGPVSFKENGDLSHGWYLVVFLKYLGRASLMIAPKPYFVVCCQSLELPRFMFSLFRVLKDEKYFSHLYTFLVVFISLQAWLAISSCTSLLHIFRRSCTHLMFTSPEASDAAFICPVEVIWNLLIYSLNYTYILRNYQLFVIATLWYVSQYVCP